MKRSHIIILIGIALVIAGLIAYSADFSTYDSINSAKEKPGKFVHIIAQLDKTKPVEFDPVKNPNYLSFYAVDSLGGTTKVVLKGKMQADGNFECSDILLKCPSKYKEEKGAVQKNLNEQTSVIN